MIIRRATSLSTHGFIMRTGSNRAVSAALEYRDSSEVEKPPTDTVQVPPRVLTSCGGYGLPHVVPSCFTNMYYSLYKWESVVQNLKSQGAIIKVSRDTTL